MDLPPNEMAFTGMLHLEEQNWRQLGIFFIIYMEFSAYILTRQVVNLFEWVLAWRGHKRQLRLRLRKAKTYEEWIKIAKELDQYMGFDDWKENGDDGYFDYTLVGPLFM
jgi:hypothetical protein